MTSDLRPVAEGQGPRGLWCVAYPVTGGGVDVLAFKCRVHPGGTVDLGATVLAGRLRMGETFEDDAWVSTIGEQPPSMLRELAAWVLRAAPNGT